MIKRDASEIKRTILKFIEEKGPTLPVYISKEIQMEMMFASAFLSELISEKKIKCTNLRVGSSAVYYLIGQEEKLENFSEYLKSKEKEAFEKLKKDRFLEDQKQDPAIRIALRSIKDFAIPLEKEENLFWMYYLEDENNLNKKELQREEIFIKNTNKKDLKKPKQIKNKKVKAEDKNNLFFISVKEKLSKESIEIQDILSFTKQIIILKIIEKGIEKIIFAYNKKRIGELEIIKAHKKAEEFGLNYKIITKGDPPKKIISLIDALKKLETIEIIK